MSANGLETFDTTLQKTNHWLNDIMDDLGWSDRHWAFLALKGVLHSLRDRLPVDEVAQLGAQLPMLVRGLYYEGWKPAGKPLRSRHRDDFVLDSLRYFREAALADILGQSPWDEAEVARAVFRVIARHTTEAPSLRHVMPEELRALLPAA
jgi:uncharacterized protein (DUF2267 family)